MAIGRRSYPGNFKCQLIAIGALLLLATLFHVFLSSYVQQNQVYTQAAAQGSAFTALAVGDVAFYNAGGFAPIDGAQTQVYSFNWFVFASDALRPFVVTYTLVAVVLAVLIPLDTLTALLYQPIVILLLLVELAKLVYYVLILLGLFGFSCAGFAFCRNRNPAITATPDFAFIVSLIGTGVWALVYIVLTTLPGAVRRAHLASDPIGAQLLAEQAYDDRLPAPLFSDQIQSTYTTKGAVRRSKKRHGAGSSKPVAGAVRPVNDGIVPLPTMRY